jgi:hypothetical protein
MEPKYRQTDFNNLARDKVSQVLRDIEQQTEIEIPKEITEVAENFLQNLHLDTEEDIIRFAKEITRDYRKLLKTFEEDARQLDDSCKTFVDRMLNDFFR